jgi:hypothetical protein
MADHYDMADHCDMADHYDAVTRAKKYDLKYLSWK